MVLVNLHHLYYFWMVAREGSVTKACKKLFLAQPTVSTQIMQLEKFLGKKLFDREKRRLALTPEGRVVLDYANEIFGFTQELLGALKNLPGKQEAVLCVGIDTDISKRIVTQLLKAVYSHNSSARVVVREGKPRDLVEQLRTHVLDLVLTDQGRFAEDGETYWRRAVGRLPIFFVAVPRLARQVKFFPKDLAKIPLILPEPGTPLFNSIEQFLGRSNVKPRVIAEIQDADLIRLSALEGLGAAPLDHVSVAMHLKARRLMRLGQGPAGFTETLWLIAKKRHRQNPVVQHLLAHFQLSN